MDSVAPERRLAQANLLRVRGQLVEAKAALIALLADRPDDRDTLDLLARTCEDAGELEEARKWRGIAGTKATGEGGAAPSRRGLPIPALLWVVGLVGVTLWLAFSAGASHERAELPPTLQNRVEAPPTTANPLSEPTVDATPTTSGATIPTTVPTAPVGVPGQTTAEARGLARLLAAEGGAARSLAVAHDPRTDTATVTFAPREGEPIRREAATLARASFGAFPTVRTLQLRAVRGRELVYVATAPRDRLAATEAEGWARENEAKPDALADALLIEEWTAPIDGNASDVAGLGGP